MSGLSSPVKPAWVVGTAEFRIPLLGNIRLWASQAGVVGAVPAETGVVQPEWARDGADATVPELTTAETTAETPVVTGPTTAERPTGLAMDAGGAGAVFAAG